MSVPGQSYPFTADLREEFEAETQALLRQRFLWFTGVLAGLAILLLILGFTAGAVMGMGGLTGSAPIVEARVIGGLALAAYLGCFLAAKRGAFSRVGLLRLTYTLVVVDGVLQVVGSWMDVPGSVGLLGVAITHVIACSFLPWTPAQAIRPLIPVLLLDAILTLVLSNNAIPARLLAITLGISVGVPGTILCWLRHSRRLEMYKLRFFQRRYGEVRRELVDARRIHEALFPPPLTDGDVQFGYLYEPMRQIGGDYLYAVRQQGRSDLSVVLMDVTGHGIPAALTVNRLHGELQRIFAEQPGIDPGQVLRLLNRYVHLTLANHSVYVTALCIRVNLDSDTLEFASGGHPPAYICGVDGTVHELVSTSFVLGACGDAEFDPEPVTHRFGPGDTLIAYTDGALEARSRQGRMIGLAGMRRLVAGPGSRPAEGWPAHILRAVERHRDGPPNDDTLVIEIARPVRSRAAPDRAPSRSMVPARG